MPSLAGATEWVNSEPLGPAELRAARHVESSREEVDQLQRLRAGGALVREGKLVAGHLIERFERADIERDPQRRQQQLTVVVIGGSLVGTSCSVS